MSIQTDSTTAKDPAGIPVSVDQAELSYLDGVTSNVQTQLNGKASSSHTHTASEVVSGQVALARGGTHADLSATGPGVLKQASTGADVTVGAIAESDVTNLVSDLAGKAGVGTGDANQVPVYSGGTGITGSKEWLMSFQTGGAYASGIKLTTSIPATGAGDGVYEVDILLSASGGNLNYFYPLHFRVVSGALSGTPIAPGARGNSNPPNITVSAESGFFRLTVNTTGTWDVFVRVKTYNGQAGYFTGWALSDAAPVGGTNAAFSVAFGPVSGTTGAFSSTVDSSGGFILSGTPGGLGASARYIGGGGASNVSYHNVPASGNFSFAVAESVAAIITANYISPTLDIVLNSARGVRNNTSDGSDNGSSRFNGGGGFGNSRGAGVDAYGNEHSTGHGRLELYAGNDASDGTLRLITGNGVVRLQFANDGTVTGSMVNAANGLCGLDGSGKVATAQLPATGTTGAIELWGTGSAPSGYLLCDGSAVSRTTYSALFALLSTTFGTGDGSTTFNLPDLRGRAPIGVGTGSGLTARALADQVGVETVTLTAAQSGLPAHTHTGGAVSSGFTAGSSGSWAVPTFQDTGSTGGSAASSSHTNMQPSLALNFIIKT